MELHLSIRHKSTTIAQGFHRKQSTVIKKECIDFIKLRKDVKPKLFEHKGIWHREMGKQI